MPTSDHHNWLDYLRRGITDLWFVSSIIIAVLLLLVLADYHVSDPGWSASGSGETQHMFGAVGAYLADALLSFFGYTAYLIPIGLIFMGWHSVKRAHLDAELMAWKFFCLVVSVIALSGIFSLHWPTNINSLAISAGGMLGQKLSLELLGIWSLPIVMAIYGIFVLLGLTVLLEINWLKFFEMVGRAVFFMLGSAGLLLKRKEDSVAVNDDVALAKRDGIRERFESTPELDATALPLDWRDYKENVIDEFSDASDDVDDAPVRLSTSDEYEDRNVADWLNVESSDENTEPTFTFDEEISDDNKIDSSKIYSTEVVSTEAGSADDELVCEQQDNDSNDSIYDDSFDEAIAWIDENESAITPEFTVEENESYVVEDQLNNTEEKRPSQETISPLGMKVNLPQSDKAEGNRFAIKNNSKNNSEADYQLPDTSLLAPAAVRHTEYSDEELQAMKYNVEEALRNYRLDVNVVNIAVGPVVTCLELDLAPGIKVSQISNLDKDIARSLAVQSVRVVEVIPGKPYIGLEIPNRKRDIVHLRSILESGLFRAQKSPLTLVLGDDISGKPVVANLGKMPHLLVAGTTGSGKSVGINVMLASMLYKARPDELKLILIDPKMLEMSMYEDIPHLLTPVVTDMNDAENALRWAVAEMERRYQLMSAMKVRNIDGFNQILREKTKAGEYVTDPLWQPEDHLGIAHQPPQLEPLPYIVIVIDELADMMMAVGKKVEELIARIAQKARAAGIHLILATQRPSVDVITGLIKANVPTRISFQVSSKIDSRTILGSQGAESLLGHGDMLFAPPGSGEPQRVHGAYIDDQEVDRLTSFVKAQGEPNYESAIISPVAPQDMGAFGAGEKSDDPELDLLYDDAVALVVEHGKASISWLQRRLSIGYQRSARIIEAMEQAGIVSAPERGARKVLMKKPEYPDDY